MSKLKSFLDWAIPIASSKDSEHLGDRTTYIGASDIAGCPRKAILEKLSPAPRRPKQLLIFARGHLAQAMYARYFKLATTFKVYEEVELRHPGNKNLRCHIDLLLIAKDQAGNPTRVHVVEVKSTDGIPEEPYSSWVDQLNFQLGLVNMCYCSNVHIGGSILVVDMNAGDYREFNGHKPNMNVFQILVQKGERMFEALKDGTEPESEPGFLCGNHCSYRKDCPAFSGPGVELPEDLYPILNGYKELQNEKLKIEARLDALKKQITAFTGEERINGLINDIQLQTVVVAPSQRVDSSRLKKDYPEVYAACISPSKGYVKVEVTRLESTADDKQLAA